MDFKKQTEQKRLEIQKQQNQPVIAIIVEDKAAFFRTPRRAEVSYAMTLLANDPLQAYSSVLQSCYLEGDREILDDDDYFISAAPNANALISTKVSEVLK